MMIMVCTEFLDTFDDTKTKESDQLRTLQSNIVTTLEHISSVSTSQSVGLTQPHSLYRT